MVFVVNGNGAIVNGNNKVVVLITGKVTVVISTSCGDTLTDSRGVFVKVLKGIHKVFVQGLDNRIVKRPNNIKRVL